MLPAIEALLEAAGAATEGGEAGAAAGGATEGGGFLNRIMSTELPLPIKKSSCIASAGYVIKDGVLHVTFQSGGEAYHKTDPITVARLLSADSVGSFYNRELRGH